LRIEEIDMTIHWSNFFAARLLGLAAVVVVVVSGCSDQGKKVTINGTISYRGQPVPSGILRFVGLEGAYSAAVIQPDGTFIITDVVPGEVKVGVMESPQGSGSSGGKTSPAAKAPTFSLPGKYQNPESSGLTYTITSETRQLNIDIN
jgi:hypothetical protein